MHVKTLHCHYRYDPLGVVTDLLRKKMKLMVANHLLNSFIIFSQVN